MLFPIRDVIPSRTTPFVTWTLIAPSVVATFVVSPAAPVAFVAVQIGLNVLTLWVFGRTVEDQLGHARFLIVYLGCGVAAAWAQAWGGSPAELTLAGTIGATAGVLGAYFAMYPRARVVTILFLILYINVIEIPAFFVLAFWVLVQVIGGLDRAADPLASGGFAWWAEVVGLLGGAVIAPFVRRPERRRVDWWD